MQITSKNILHHLPDKSGVWCKDGKVIIEHPRLPKSIVKSTHQQAYDQFLIDGSHIIEKKSKAEMIFESHFGTKNKYKNKIINAINEGLRYGI